MYLKITIFWALITKNVKKSHVQNILNFHILMVSIHVRYNMFASTSLPPQWAIKLTKGKWRKSPICRRQNCTFRQYCILSSTFWTCSLIFLIKFKAQWGKLMYWRTYRCYMHWHHKNMRFSNIFTFLVISAQKVVIIRHFEIKF